MRAPGSGSRPTSPGEIPRLKASRTIISCMKGLKVLVVDDNPTYCLTLNSNWPSGAWTVQMMGEARRPCHAIRTPPPKASPYHLAIIDQNLTITDGLNLVCSRPVKADPAISPMLLLMLLSSDLPESTRGSSGTLDVCLRKPVRVSHLYNAILALVTPVSRPSSCRRTPIPSGPGCRSICSFRSGG